MFRIDGWKCHQETQICVALLSWGRPWPFPPEVGPESLRAGGPLPASHPDLRAGGHWVPSAAGTLRATIKRVRFSMLTV